MDNEMSIGIPSTFEAGDYVMCNFSGGDPWFFSLVGAPLMSDVTDRWYNQMLQNSSYIRMSQTILAGGGERAPAPSP